MYIVISNREKASNSMNLIPQLQKMIRKSECITSLNEKIKPNNRKSLEISSTAYKNCFSCRQSMENQHLLNSCPHLHILNRFARTFRKTETTNFVR